MAIPSNTVVNPDNIPKVLKELRHWVLWRYEQRNNKITKIPYRADGGKAKTDTRYTWGDFETIYKQYLASLNKPKPYNGIGFVFSKTDGYVGIDLDGVLCPDTGEQLPIAAEIIQTLDSYTEITPSGAGYHIIIRGDLPEGWRKKTLKYLSPLGGKNNVEIEIYQEGRYFTMTGNAV